MQAEPIFASTPVPKGSLSYLHLQLYEETPIPSHFFRTGSWGFTYLYREAPTSSP